ncbi:MAG: hypothetical protein Q8P92_04380 [Candidatus Daviesbacteria bacterium]|nr:hypothetical protein [Candidatus Daviesbacteria bacterium]
MADYKYLKDEQHYIDQYDLFTIKQCLKAIESWREAYAKHLKSEEAKETSAGDKAKMFNWISNQELFQIKGNRYRQKKETIQQWMDDDRIKQDKYDNTPEPENIHCTDCKRIMHTKLKHLSTLDDLLRMMFLFDCSSCKKKVWVYEDGKVRESTPDLCPKCKAEAKMSVVKESKDKIIWKISCNSCGFSETTVDDFEKSRAERKKREEEEKKLLEEYREELCTDEEGKKSFEYIEALKIVPQVYEEELKKYDSFAYQKAAGLKKLTIIELEKLLNGIFEKEQYIKLTFNNPEIGQHVIVSFNLQDADTSRKEGDSVINLQKTIKGTLEGTNWRLMSDGLSYRLGYISGRLKGYEREEDFFELSGAKKEEKSSKIDHETMMRYGGNHAVQIARLSGEFQGIENVRKRRLEKEPDGFLLEGDEIYTCMVCKENTPGNRIWWNLDGITCFDCHLNIKNGSIPVEVVKNSDIWLQNWQIADECSLHTSTIQKLRRQGVLKGKELTREDGTSYCTIYLIDENKEFFEKHPRKPRQRMVITDLLGNKIEL